MPQGFLVAACRMHAMGEFLGMIQKCDVGQGP